MDILLNNNKKEIPSSSSLKDILVTEHLYGKKGIAIALNNEVVPKASWESTPLKKNDTITIIQATQGG